MEWELCVSAVAAIIATNTDEQLDMMFNHMSEFDLSFFSNSTASQFFRHFLLKGTLQDIEVLQNRLRRLLGDDTFLTAYLRTGILLALLLHATCAALDLLRTRNCSKLQAIQQPHVPVRAVKT